MTLLRPSALLVFVLAVPVIALYVLRLRRPERAISSTLLWRGMVEDMRANAPWQRLRLSLLLGVQLLTLAALALALAEPAFSHDQEFAGDVILVVDQSYTMQATDASPSRFAQAQARARTIAAELSGTSSVSVVGMGAQPTLAIAQSSDRAALDSAIGRLAPGARTTNLSAAMSLAASLARPGRQTHAVILSDRSSHLSTSSIRLPFPVTILRFGSLRRDLGIVGLSATAGTFTHALVRIHNFGQHRTSSDLNLYGDGQLVDVRPVTAPPGTTVSLTWDQLPAGIRRLQARLTLHDDMPADKVAWAVVPSIVQRHVLLVARADYYLETALALDPNVSLQVVAPEGYTTSLASHADVVIFDGLLPASRPSASLLVIGPPQGHLPGASVGRAAAGGALSKLTSPPRSINRYVDVRDVQVRVLRQLRLARWLKPLLRSGSIPAAAAGQRGSYREAIVAFAVQDSDWPLHISFPVFIHNLMEYLAPGTTLGATGINTGDPLPVFASPSTSSLLVTRPDGSTHSIAAPFPPYTRTEEPGVYSVQSQPKGLAPVLFSVNSLPGAASDTPAPSTSRIGGSSAAAAGRVSVPVDASWVVGLAVLALLGAEWWIGMRR